MANIDAKSLGLLKTKINEIPELLESYDPQKFDSWRTETSMMLEHFFGEKSDKVKKFNRYDGTLSISWSGEGRIERQERQRRAYDSDLKAALSFLTGISNFLDKMHEDKLVERQDIIVDEIEQSIAGDYQLHPVIAEVASPLYVQGFYRDAVRAAFIEVIDQVKKKAGHPLNKRGVELDGDDLMNQTFGSESKTPMLQWSELSNRPEKDFQQGMMYLFKGVVGLRNEKGHMNVEQKDKDKALEYLTLASLLVRQIDESKKDG